MEKPPKMGKYDGKGDPDEYMKLIKDRLNDLSADETSNSKLFALTLIGMTRKWFSGLPNGSIACVEQVENVDGDVDVVICIDTGEEGDKEGLKFSNKKFSKACVKQLENVYNGDDDGDADDITHIDVKNEEQSGDIVGEGGDDSRGDDDGVKSIRGLRVGDERHSIKPKKKKMMERKGRDFKNEFDDCEESEEIETSDEEFQVDNVNEVFNSDDSCGDDDDDVQSVRGLRVRDESDSIKPK
ncbi:uncharacterized protein LOC131631583 [Vicia villosa]|uniref:uncharacterized protein LOC131631583 n=1 Tax=Vicia villosa TaxID=3911 RepID=UPI00273BCBB4|nr:uncharacterized protein LOC131631583 [Vicia villosa]